MSLPLDARPGVPGASPQPDRVEQPQKYEQVYADLRGYLGLQLSSPTYESVNYRLDEGAEFSFLVDISETGVDELLEGTGIQPPLSKFNVNNSAFIRLSDTDEGKIIRLGIAFSGESEGQPSENFGIELNLAETDGAIGIYESQTTPDTTSQGVEERLKTEKAHMRPDQLRKIAQILDRYSPSGSITHRVTRRVPASQRELARRTRAGEAIIARHAAEDPDFVPELRQAIEDVNTGRAGPLDPKPDTA